jgi:Na+-transporting NADH:ubiquinone oxidoreductase subunit F
VALLLAAKARLVASGDVTIVVNDDPAKALRVPAGGTLLGSLAEKAIYIPSACGGKGACGVCEVIVREGGGDLLPTETGFISRGAAKRGCRLACQVKVKRDMRIEVAPEIFSVRKWTCRVVSNRNVATFIKELKLALPEGEEVPFRAGGYVQIQCPAYDVSFRDFDIDAAFRPTWDRFDLWRFRASNPAPLERAYSMANFPLEKGILLFTIRIAFPPGYRAVRSASSSPATPTRRCASSEAAPAWRRCARTSSTSCSACTPGAR